MKKIILIALIALTPLFAQVKENIEVPYVPYEIKMGKGFEAVNANCLMCHSFGYILNQGPQPRAFWRAKIYKMIDAFKAPISGEDAKSVEDYLATYYSNGK
ncbi:MAG: sulfite:cytochrome C oxidoreductase subunit B [Sulfurimonas sp.]|uniref:sulfite:cytochrome C oxidoreductase subunit B n=1 Tax=Sulfurimonas sp. TaxID=2022749 RepID=UPI00262C6079|nr:sulfite:cytochrome C oxidoreductase subunit B [Sulfurimonas sp.]MDD3476469.1 sulfite:cytochrome C oxidoreductase subunit B [Sulfurimonas sp.]